MSVRIFSVEPGIRAEVDLPGGQWRWSFGSPHPMFTWSGLSVKFAKVSCCICNWLRPLFCSTLVSTWSHMPLIWGAWSGFPGIGQSGLIWVMPLLELGGICSHGPSHFEGELSYCCLSWGTGLTVTLLVARCWLAWYQDREAWGQRSYCRVNMSQGRRHQNCTGGTGKTRHDVRRARSCGKFIQSWNA